MLCSDEPNKMKWQTETKKFRQKIFKHKVIYAKTVWVWVVIFWLNHTGNCLSSYLHSARVGLSMWVNVPDLGQLIWI